MAKKKKKNFVSSHPVHGVALRQECIKNSRCLCVIISSPATYPKPQKAPQLTFLLYYSHAPPPHTHCACTTQHSHEHTPTSAQTPCLAGPGPTESTSLSGTAQWQHGSEWKVPVVRGSTLACLFLKYTTHTYLLLETLPPEIIICDDNITMSCSSSVDLNAA